MTNRERFIAELTKAYALLFTTPDYAFTAQRTTPALLATKMTDGIVAGSANHDGAGIRRACKAVGIRSSRTAIVAFVTAE